MFSLFKRLIDRLMELNRLLDETQGKLEKAMATSKDFLDLLAAMDAETTRIATKLDELLAKLQAGGMSEAEEAEVFAAANALSDRLKTIGTDPVTPIPPTEPPTT